MIKSQLDTSIYKRNRRGSIGDVLGAIQGIQSIAGGVQNQRDDEYLNTVIGKHMTGWDGKDQADYTRRVQTAYNEALRDRPELYSKITPMVETGKKVQRAAQEEESILSTRKLENESAYLKLKNAQADLVGTYFADIDPEDEQAFNDTITALTARGVPPKVDYQTFRQNPKMFYDRILSSKISAEKKLKDIESKMKESQLEEQEYDTQKAKKEVEWFDLEKQAAINQMNRSSGGGGPVDTMGLSTLDYIAASEFAVRKYGKRRGSAMTPIIAKAMSEGITLDKMDDYLRYSQQSEEFSGAAREGMQQIFAGKSGKAVDFAFNSFDDLLEKGDKKAIGNYLKKTARGSAGTQQASEILGVEGTLNLLDEIQGDIDKFEAAGGNTNIFTGTAENVRKKLGFVKNEEMRKIAEKVQAAIMKHRNDVSGKAFSIPETAEYRGLFPSITNTGELNSVKIKALKDVFNNKLQNFYIGTMGENAYNEFIAGTPSSPQLREQQSPTQPTQIKPRKVWNPQTGTFELRQ